eukprot:tig00021603_g22823.t1
MSWLDALLTKTFGPKGAPRLQFGELNAAIGATVEMKNRENVLRGDGGAWRTLRRARWAPHSPHRARRAARSRTWPSASGTGSRLPWSSPQRLWRVSCRRYPLEPGVKLERANAVSVKKAKRALVLEVPKTASQFLPTSEYDGTEDTEKVAFNKRKTYKAIREGQLLPTDAVPGLPGTTAGELLVRNLRLQYVSRLRRSKAKKARLDSGDSSSSS